MKKSQEQIFQFVNSYSQEESKQLLWTLLKSAAIGNLGDLLPIERENLLSFIEMLSKMIDGVHEEYPSKPDR